ncbi:hypothetical protein ACFVUS_12395 [Nocardia sp. NPDC058058]|uniref:hypothetical protein n=1 Tax=Nocardia sp. NPDC058058 TaxID=3346317 RepID=UPI0036DA43C7
MAGRKPDPKAEMAWVLEQIEAKAAKGEDTAELEQYANQLLDKQADEQLRRGLEIREEMRQRPQPEPDEHHPGKLF